MQWLFGLFTKIIKRSGTSFCCTFPVWFFYKNLIFHLWTKFRCHTFFPSRDIKRNVLLSSYLDNWWRHELWDLSSIILKSNGRQVEKEGRTEIKKIEYLEKEKSFLDEIKSIVHNFWRNIIWWKNKKLIKIADRSFKDSKS